MTAIPLGPLIFRVTCFAECHSFSITSDEIRGDAQRMYNALWDRHDEVCHTSCLCQRSGATRRLRVSFEYAAGEPYETTRQHKAHSLVRRGQASLCGNCGAGRSGHLRSTAGTLYCRSTIGLRFSPT